jgi:hypothetical protein
MNYVLVESGEIKESPGPLPLNWKNISNLPALDNDTLRSYGWYPCRIVYYDGPMDNKVYTTPIFALEENEYVEYQQVRDMTQEEIDTLINSQWNSVRARRNILLQESDWTQLGDVKFSPEKEQEWKDYRRQLRDITTYPDPFSLPWPTEPSYEPVSESSAPTGATGPTS